jgi:hypothetical protein
LIFMSSIYGMDYGSLANGSKNSGMFSIWRVVWDAPKE